MEKFNQDTTETVYLIHSHATDMITIQEHDCADIVITPDYNIFPPDGMSNPVQNHLAHYALSLILNQPAGIVHRYQRTWVKQ